MERIVKKNHFVLIVLLGLSFLAGCQEEDYEFQLALKSKLATQDDATDLVLDGNYAYLATGESGLTIVDITDISNPEMAGVFVTAEQSAFSLCVSGEYAYIGEASANLAIVDISNQEHPELISNYKFEDDYTAIGIWDLLIDGNYLYVAGYNKFFVMNISDKSNPTVIGYLDTVDCIGLYKISHYVYVANGDRGLSIISIGETGIPSLVKTISTGNNVMRMDKNGNYLYTIGSLGMNVIDVSSAMNPIFIKKISTATGTDIDVNSDYAYIAGSRKGLIVVNAENPLNPLPTLQNKINGEAMAIQVMDAYIYIADISFGLKIYDGSGVF
jgi:hypothetical protein